jgi:Fe(3+) dicitrate transport protein
MRALFFSLALALPGLALAQDEEDEDIFTLDPVTAGGDEEAEGQEEEAEEEEEGEEEGGLYRLDPLTVAYSPEEVFEIGGSVSLVDEEELEAFEYDDPHSALLHITGVYVRTEDGFGLRPNIGIRGASAERSRAVTLMEDGVLLAPAPYSAPAAYYFPVLTRMVGIEVFKGPAAILYGPHTVGGAVNLLSREPPAEPGGAIDLSFGRFRTRKLHLHYGASNDWGGYLVELVDLGSAGFKDIDFSDDTTGFHRSEALLTGWVQTDPEASLFQRFELRLGFSRERSDETYLGLTDADFEQDPYRRYVASERDRMRWSRAAARIRHRLELGDDLELVTTAYSHYFTRSWRRLNRFRDGTSFLEVLAAPTGRREVLYRNLTGEEDTASPDESLMIIDNDRDFVSEGIQTVARFRFETGRVEHRFEIGARLHHDRVEREHVEEGFLMQDRTLVPDGRPEDVVTRNSASAIALATHLVYQLRMFGLTLSPGLRSELVFTESDNHLTGEGSSDRNHALLPGFGAQYAITEELGVLAGVYRGFSPVAPGQPDEVDPETSINYEAGVRYSDPERGTLAELIGFFNDYQNLTGECSFSVGCSNEMLDRQFNAGEVFVFGLEAQLSHRFTIARRLYLPVQATYTFTHTSFRTTFDSEDPQLGDVQRGDHLPYVPAHQAALQIGIGNDDWSANISTTYVGEMREQAGQGDPAPGEATDDYVMLDAVGRVRLFRRGELYVRLENMLNAQPIASRRPFGARPIRPFGVQAGFTFDL